MKDQSTSVSSVYGGAGSLHAWISISSDYTRQLVTAAMQRRNKQWTFMANNEMNAPTLGSVHAAAAAASIVLPSPSDPTAAWPLHLHFCEFERIDWGAGLSSPCAANGSATPLLVSSYPVRKGLIRKAQLAFLLKKFAAKRPNSILHKTIPETLIMTIDDPEYLEEALNDVYEVRDMVEGVDMWIMKASMINRAMGIHIISSVRDVEKIIMDEQYEEIREWVLQRYIQRPLLVNGCKFHIRVYVLAVGNLSVYMWSKMLCLIAMEPYERSVVTRSSHITNTCANKDHPLFDEASQVKLLDELIPDSASLSRIHSQMVATLHDVFCSLHSEPTVFLPVPHAFELFGCDFLLDEQMNCFFLEANAGPDFAMTGDRLRKIVVEDMMEAVCDIAVDGTFNKFYQTEEKTTPTPAAAAAAAATETNAATAAANETTGEFIKCYEVVNSTSITMNFY